MGTTQRARDRANEHCIVCQVPAGEACRSLTTHAAYPTLLHDQPLAISETEKQSVLDDHSQYFNAQSLGLSNVKRAKKRLTNASNSLLLEEKLPAADGTVIYVEGLVSAATLAASEFRTWRRAAMLFRVAGSWSVLGGGPGVVDLIVPPASAGASGWAATFSLPGSDILRLSVTGTGTVIWVAAIDIFPF